MILVAGTTGSVDRQVVSELLGTGSAARTLTRLRRPARRRLEELYG